MSATLAIVAVPNASPVWRGRDGVALTPVRLPVVSGAALEGDWSVLGRDPGRGDAIAGPFASFEGSADDLPGISSFAANGRALIAQYLSWQALSLNAGQLINCYA